MAVMAQGEDRDFSHNYYPRLIMDVDGDGWMDEHGYMTQTHQFPIIIPAAAGQQVAAAMLALSTSIVVRYMTMAALLKKHCRFLFSLLSQYSSKNSSPTTYIYIYILL
jgi:hypothetical protein